MPSQQQIYKIFVHTCRILFGVTFICSGFVKAVDPWGTAIKVNEYLAIYGLESLRPGVMVFSIWLCGAELMMGCMMLFKVRIRLISIFAVVSMFFFTVLTLLSATVLPVEDCGCFGDAVKLTPWETFGKNAVLLPMAAVVWWRYRHDRIFTFTRCEVLLTVVFCIFGMGVGTYCYYHLPLIDFLPYRKGVNIYAEMQQAAAEDMGGEVVLVYRNRRTGRLRKFTLTDKAWHNDKKWEWVETRVDDDEAQLKKASLAEFNIYDDAGDATEQVLTVPGRLYMLCVTDLDALSPRCAATLRRWVEKADAEHAAVVCLTPQYLDGKVWWRIGGSRALRFYNIDATTLQTMLRAEVGVVELQDGVIVRKLNWRDM